jgi:hypothetical protein
MCKVFKVGHTKVNMARMSFFVILHNYLSLKFTPNPMGTRLIYEIGLSDWNMLVFFMTNATWYGMM